MKAFGWITNGLSAVIAALSTAPPEQWADKRVVGVAVTTFLLGALRSGRQEREKAKREEITKAIEEGLKRLEGKVEADAEVMGEVCRELLSELTDVAAKLQDQDWRIEGLEERQGELDERVGELEDSIRKREGVPDELYAAVGSYRMASSDENMRRFHDFLNGEFRLDQIEVIGKRAGVDWDDIPGGTKEVKAWNLIEEAKRAGLLQALVGEAVARRPNGISLLRGMVEEGGGATAGAVWPGVSVPMGGPKVSEPFAGREEEMKELRKALRGKKTVVAVVGMAGQGKSCLAGEWYKRGARPPEGVGLFWRRVYEAGYSFDRFVNDLHLYLTGAEINAQEVATVEGRAALALAALKERPCWIVLDGVERWLKRWAAEPDAGVENVTVDERGGRMRCWMSF